MHQTVAKRSRLWELLWQQAQFSSLWNMGGGSGFESKARGNVRLVISRGAIRVKIDNLGPNQEILTREFME